MIQYACDQTGFAGADSTIKNSTPRLGRGLLSIAAYKSIRYVLCRLIKSAHIVCVRYRSFSSGLVAKFPTVSDMGTFFPLVAGFSEKFFYYVEKIAISPQPVLAGGMEVLGGYIPPYPPRPCLDCIDYSPIFSHDSSGRRRRDCVGNSSHLVLQNSLQMLRAPQMEASSRRHSSDPLGIDLQCDTMSSLFFVHFTIEN